jgi:hypothetical protein
MVVMPARPDVKVDAWPIAIVTVVPGAMQVPAVPVASVPYLHRAFSVHRFEASGYAAHRRGLSRYCHEAEGQRGCDGCEQTTAYHELELPCVCGRGAFAKKRNVVFALPSVVNWPTRGLAQQFRARPKTMQIRKDFQLAAAM